MSLVNQVLRDLDRRHAGPAGRPDAVRTLPAARTMAPWWWGRVMAGLLVIAVMTASGLVWSLRSRPAPVPDREADASLRKAASSTDAPAGMPAPASTPVIIAAMPAASAVAPEASEPARHTATSVDGTQVKATVQRPLVAVTVPRPSGRSSTDRLASRATPPASAPAIEKRVPLRTARERAEAEYQRAASLRQQGRPGDAATAYASALREDPAFTPARQGWAGLLIVQGRTEEAKAVLSDGLLLQPSHPGLAMLLARLLVEQGELQHAAAVLQPVPVLGARAEELGLRAAILQRLGRHAEACELFSAALRVVPMNGAWWMGLGISLVSENRNDEAREAFDRARESGTLSPELTRYVDQHLRQL